MTYQVHCDNRGWGKTFRVFVLNTEDRVVSSCTGIETVERCRMRAEEYSHNFGNATILENIH
jgi:hypothetical protein